MQNLSLKDPLNASISGNAATATKLATKRSIGFSGITAAAQQFDGSGNITFTVTAVPASIITGTVGSATKATQDGNGAVIANTYLKLAGGTMTGTISSSINTVTFRQGSMGENVALNLTGAGANYKTIFKVNSTNGAFTMTGYGTNLIIGYQSNTSITANTNSLDKQITLLNESGNTTFPRNCYGICIFRKR